MLFEILAGEVIPRLPTDARGQERVADGEVFLSIQQAVALTGRTSTSLETLWKTAFSDILPDRDNVGTEQSLLGSAGDEEPAVGAAIVDPFPTDPPKMESAKLDLLHRYSYPHLDADEFSFLIDACRERGLNPWAKHLAADFEIDEVTKRRKLVLITTIAAFRLIAERTKQWTGTTSPTYCAKDGTWRDIWLEPEPPAVARVGVKRKGFDDPCFGEAYWDQYAPYPLDGSGTPKLHPIWARRKHMQLAKCAEALGFRMAFPESFGDLYTRDEMMQRKNPTPTSPGPSPRANNWDNIAGSGVSTDDEPVTRMQMELRLVDLGFKSVGDRAAIFQQFRQRYPSLVSNEPMLYAAMLRELTLNPKAYGAVIDA